MQNKLVKLFSGYIFKDDFEGSMNPMWDIFPSNSNRVAVNSDSVTILKGEDEAQLLINTPESSEYVFQTELVYNPTSIGEAGCILKSITENFVECEFSYDENDISNYRFVKIFYSHNYIINFRASKDGVIWEDFGNTKFIDSNFIGYYICDTNTDLEIVNCNIYRNNFITIKGLLKDCNISFLDKKGNKIIENFDIKVVEDTATADFSNVLFPVKDVTLVVTNKKGELFRETIKELYGGDILSVNNSVYFEVKDIGSKVQDFNLGVISDDYKLFELDVVNTNDAQIDGILKIIPTSNYDKGNFMAYLSEYTSIEDIKELKEIKVSIPGGSTSKYFIKIVKDYKYITIDNNFSFNVVLV